MSNAGGATTEAAPPAPEATTPPTEEKRVVEVAIDPTGASERERGKISYTYNTPSDPKGVFSFSYYFRPTPGAANRNVHEISYRFADKVYRYVFGMTKYLDILAGEETFRDWKIIIFTDNATLAALSQLPAVEDRDARGAAATLFAHPNIIVAKCEWPEYSQVQTAESIDGVILRVLRHKAMMDFPSIPVLVRDADTYFDENVYFPEFPAMLGIWEATLFRKQQESGKPFLVAGSPSYKRGWHANIITKASSVGLLAGLVNRIQEIAEWKSGQLWQESLSFIRGRCKINAERREISNLREPTYVGKDEQIIIFIWIPALIEQTFFFFFDYHDQYGDSGHYLNQWERPGNIFYPVYQQLMTEFSKYIDPATKKFKIQYGESPYMKLWRIWDEAHGNAFRLHNPGSPMPWETREIVTPDYTEEEFRPFMERALQKYISQGTYIEEDVAILDQLPMTYLRIWDRLEPFCVTYAFDNPFYQRMLYLMWQALNSNYRIVCSRVAAPTAMSAPTGGAAGGASAPAQPVAAPAARGPGARGGAAGGAEAGGSEAGGVAGGTAGGRRRRRTIKKKNRKTRRRRGTTRQRRPRI